MKSFEIQVLSTDS